MSWVRAPSATPNQSIKACTGLDLFKLLLMSGGGEHSPESGPAQGCIQQKQMPVKAKAASGRLLLLLAISLTQLFCWVFTAGCLPFTSMPQRLRLPRRLRQHCSQQRLRWTLPPPPRWWWQLLQRQPPCSPRWLSPWRLVTQPTLRCSRPLRQRRFHQRASCRKRSGQQQQRGRPIGATFSYFSSKKGMGYRRNTKLDRTGHVFSVIRPGNSVHSRESRSLSDLGSSAENRPRRSVIPQPEIPSPTNS